MAAYTTFLTLAHQLADAAGAAIRPYFGAHGEVATKPDDSPVTQADRAAEQAMRALIAAQFPEHAIYGEEFGSSDHRIIGSSDYTWALDPIDGTRAFIAGRKEWGTLIALCENGVPILGILDQPITGERWVGVKGEGTQYSVATTNSVIARSDSDEAIQPKENRVPQTRHAGLLRLKPRNDGGGISSASISTTSRRYFTPAQARAFDALSKQCSEVIEDGDCYAYGLLARGERDLVVDAGLKPYDILALVPIIEGSGGTITAWDGSAITLTNAGTAVAARTRELHAIGVETLHQR